MMFFVFLSIILSILHKMSNKPMRKTRVILDQKPSNGLDAGVKTGPHKSEKDHPSQELQLCNNKLQPNIPAPSNPLMPLKSTKKELEVWSKKDDELLYQKYMIYGPKWTILSQFIAKDANTIKNKFYGRMRKLSRRLKSVGNKKIRPSKLLTYQSLIRPIQALDLVEEPFQGYNKQKNWLRETIINYSKGAIEQISIEECNMIIDSIHSFNLQTRSYNLRSPRHQIPKKNIRKTESQSFVKKEADMQLKNSQFNRGYKKEVDEQQEGSCQKYRWVISIGQIEINHGEIMPAIY